MAVLPDLEASAAVVWGAAAFVLELSAGCESDDVADGVVAAAPVGGCGSAAASPDEVTVSVSTEFEPPPAPESLPLDAATVELTTLNVGPAASQTQNLRCRDQVIRRIEVRLARVRGDSNVGVGFDDRERQLRNPVGMVLLLIRQFSAHSGHGVGVSRRNGHTHQF